MFFSEEVLVDSPFEATTSRVCAWVSAGQGRAEATDAMAAGGRVLARAGVAGLSKTVEVRTSQPELRDDVTVMALRWSATGPFVNLFPTLVAFLEISAAGADQSRIALVGSYKAPLGPAGDLLDQVVLHRAGLVTVRRWLRAASTVATIPDHRQDSTPPRDASADSRKRRGS